MKPESERQLRDYSPEELCELYKVDPDRFEELAEDALSQACIGRTPEQTLKNRQMQWTIDMQLRKAKTPLGRLQVMENIFYGQVFGAQGQLAQLAQNCSELVLAITGAKRVAPVTRPRLHLLKR